MTATLQRPPAKRKKGFDPDFRFTVAQYQKMIAEGSFRRMRALNSSTERWSTRYPEILLMILFELDRRRT